MLCANCRCELTPDEIKNPRTYGGYTPLCQECNEMFISEELEEEEESWDDEEDEYGEDKDRNAAEDD